MTLVRGIVPRVGLFSVTIIELFHTKLQFFMNGKFYK